MKIPWGITINQNENEYSHFVTLKMLSFLWEIFLLLQYFMQKKNILNKYIRKLVMGKDCEGKDTLTLTITRKIVQPVHITH